MCRTLWIFRRSSHKQNTHQHTTPPLIRSWRSIAEAPNHIQMHWISATKAVDLLTRRSTSLGLYCKMSLWALLPDHPFRSFAFIWKSLDVSVYLSHMFRHSDIRVLFRCKLPNLFTNARNPITQPLRHCTSCACTCTAYSILASRLRSCYCWRCNGCCCCCCCCFLYLFIYSKRTQSHSSYAHNNKYYNCLHRFPDALRAASSELLLLIRSIVDVSNFVAVVVEFFIHTISDFGFCCFFCSCTTLP